MKTQAIRSLFVDYFQQKSHQHVPSASLIPIGDDSLLFTNAGMVQFKDVFLGTSTQGFSRAVSIQKCLRAGGKHNDLENVGFTARHHTFFEMLGNFSFGDYFKKEAIHFAWDFVIHQLRLPQELLYVTVFTTDDEAYNYWLAEGVQADKIYRFGEADNFWSMGDVGPCGPCSELFIDRGPHTGCQRPDCAMGCDCDRFLEFWNLVFMQYDRTADGVLHPLPAPSVDTGAGLERLASILQDVPTNYDTDEFKVLIDAIRTLAPRKDWGLSGDLVAAARVIADHIRAIAFLIADGVLPSAMGRGYVLRRILRRAMRYGMKLGFEGPFLYTLVGHVVDVLGGLYPALKTQQHWIKKVVTSEEEQFLKTLHKGMALLEEYFTPSVKQLSGDVVFKLYDTYGFPMDLTRVICAEQGIEMDEDGFEKAMQQHRKNAQNSWKKTTDASDLLQQLPWIKEQVQQSTHGSSKFVGYDALEVEGTCIACVASGQHAQHYVVLDVTPFYPEGGGQVSDGGLLQSAHGLRAEVLSAQTLDQLVILTIKIFEGELAVGQRVLQKVAALQRRLTAAHHTATHLLQWALREVLGSHIQQAGSLVNADMLRFDFTHFEALSTEQVTAVEKLMNDKIFLSPAVDKQWMSKQEALDKGAIAFFGDKYGEHVRVVDIGGFSIEFCGGTHLDQLQQLQYVKIIQEHGVAAGVRRIIAIASLRAFEWMQQQSAQLQKVGQWLKVSHTDEIPQKIEKLHLETKVLKKEYDALHVLWQQQQLRQWIPQIHHGRSLDWLIVEMPVHPQAVKAMRDIADSIHQQRDRCCVILLMQSLEQMTLVVSCAPKIQHFLNAQQVLKEISLWCNAKGGGKAGFAQAVAAPLTPSLKQSFLHRTHEFLLQKDI